MKTETVCGKKKGGKEKTCLTSLEGRVVATKLIKKNKKSKKGNMLEEKHTKM